jgi:hypothetical protein
VLSISEAAERLEESPYVNADAMRRPIDALKAGHVDAVVARDRIEARLFYFTIERAQEY